MAIIYNKQKFPLFEVCQLLEGDVTIEEGWTARGTEIVGLLTAPMKDGVVVTPAGMAADGMIQVKLAGSGDLVIGELISNPVGVPPNEDAVEGEYTPRRGDIRFRARKLVTKQVKAESGTPIVPGNYLAPSTDTTEDYVLSETPTGVVCLANVGAGTTVAVPVLEGYIL